MLPKENRIPDKKLRKAAIKAFRSVAKMMREEPDPIVISDGERL